MSLASRIGASTPDALAHAGAWSAGATAVAVGLLVAGTLGTVGAMTVWAALHLLGVPDDWALVAAAMLAAAGLHPTATLARRVWRVERHGIED